MRFPSDTTCSTTAPGPRSCWRGSRPRSAPTEPARSTLKQRIEEFRATGAGARLSYYLWLLASVQAKGGAHRVALQTLDDAMEISTSNGDTWWDAEIHRTRANVLLELGRNDEARTALEHALSVARRQEASMLEQRARESLEAAPPNARPNA